VIITENWLASESGFLPKGREDFAFAKSPEFFGTLPEARAREGE